MKDFNLTTELKQLISSEQAYHYRVVPTAQQNGSLSFITDQTQIKTLEQELRIVLGKDIKLTQESTENIQKYLSLNYRKNQQTSSNQLSYSEDFLLNIIHEAKAVGSSDIHFEIFENTQRVRFRIDGKLLERYLISKEEYPKIVNQLKIRAGLDIAEKRLPQDGRININTSSEELDIRVSSLPTLHGEKVVLRLLSKDTTNIRLEALGFTQSELKTTPKVLRAKMALS